MHREHASKKRVISPSRNLRRVELPKPLGILLGEVDGGDQTKGVAVDEVVSGGSAAACGRLEVGDRLVSVDGYAVRDASLETVMKHIGRSRGKARSQPTRLSVARLGHRLIHSS